MGPIYCHHFMFRYSPECVVHSYYQCEKMDMKENVNSLGRRDTE